MTQKNLENILDLQKWQLLQDAIAQATHFAIILVDYRGVPVTEHSSIHPFCKAVRADDALRPFCEKCDARGGIEATRLEQPYIYRCHFDILDMAVPILFNGQYLGALLAGQIRLKKGQADLEQVLTIPTAVKNETLRRLKNKYSVLPIFSLEQTQDVAELLLQVSHYIIGEALKTEALVQVKDGSINLETADLTHLAGKLNQAAHTSFLENNLKLYVAENRRLQPAFDAIYIEKSRRLQTKHLADLCHLSVSHFAKSFKEETGENFTVFYRNLKMAWAKDWLLHTDMTVTEIADDLGFEDASYFIRLFRQTTGYAPLAYKKFVGEK